jgi:hypothetical protein
VVGAVTFTWLHDTVARNTDYWRAVLGGTMLLLVLLFPQGLAGLHGFWPCAGRPAGAHHERAAAAGDGLRKAFGGVQAVDGVALRWRRARCWR